MRFSAFIPILLTVGATVLGFLCLFAGRNPSFMQDFDVLTLNTSRIGTNIVNTVAESDNPLSALLHNVTDEVKDHINEAVGSLAKKIGIEDFYSVHILDYCEGRYTPVAVPNATFTRGDIDKNVTDCTNMTALYNFDPTYALQRSLNESGLPVTLEDLNWPQDIQRGLDALRIASKAMFVLYCIGIGLAFISFLLSFFAVFATGRLSASLNIFVAFLGFLAYGIASGISTAIASKGSQAINKYGEDIGVSATRGTKFMILTWVATAAMFLASMSWCFSCIVGHRKRAAPVLEKEV